MTQMRFNLLDEPWIDVVTAQGGMDQVGILDAFRRADELRGLGQDLSTQRFAILRVLLAFLHRALDGPTRPAWLGLWQDGLDMQSIDAYAERVRDRFWLVHPTAPFFQTPTLRATKGPDPGLRKIVADLPDGEPFFTGRTARDTSRMAWPEVAVWLIHAQAYDTAGIKTGAEDDPLVIAGKGYGYGLPAWAGQIGGISAQGASLRETLLLNLIPVRGTVDDRPAWEREVTTAWRGATTEEQQSVSGPVHLMTWQARRLLVVWDGAEAVGLTLSQGDRITPQNPPLHVVEQMTSWRFSEPQSKKYGTAIYMPQQHDPTRQAWRGLTRLLGLAQPSRAGKPEVIAPRSQLVEWLAEVESLIVLPFVRIEMAGYEYGGQNATYAEVIDDSMGIPSMLIDGAAEGEPWRAAVGDAVQQAEAVAYAVRRFAENLALASGQDRADLPQWQEACFAALDHPLRGGLADLRVDGDLTRARRTWQRRCRDVALGMADELLHNLGPHAHAGHSSGPDADPVTPAKAHNRLLRALGKTLPLTVPSTGDTLKEDA